MPIHRGRNDVEDAERLDAPVCPIHMVHMNKKHANHGGTFWGCPYYPACTITRKVEDSVADDIEAWRDLADAIQARRWLVEVSHPELFPEHIHHNKRSHHGDDREFSVRDECGYLDIFG